MIQELDADGDVVWSWRALDHVPVTETDPRWRGAQAECFGETCEDPFHWNSIELVPHVDGGAGFLISFRHTDAVYELDQATGAIRWRLGGVARRTAAATVVGGARR